MSNTLWISLAFIIIAGLLTIYNYYLYCNSKKHYDECDKYYGEYYRITQTLIYPFLFNNVQDKNSEFKNWLVDTGWKFRQIEKYDIISHVFEKDTFVITDFLCARYKPEYMTFRLSDKSTYKGFTYHEIPDILSLENKQKLIINFMAIYSS